MTKNVNDSCGIKQKDGFPYWHTPEEHKVFAQIDRKQENKDVILFQKTKNENLFEKIYKTRIPTLQIWARRYYYLMDSRDHSAAQDDMFGEMNFCFIKAIHTYNKSKGPFNTWVFYILINCVRNIVTGKKAKKRLPEGLDPKTFSNLLLSLDHTYFRSKDGNENSLKDFLPDNDNYDIIDKLNIRETINVLSSGNSLVKGFLKKLSDGETLASALKEYKTVNGEIKLGNSQLQKLNKPHRKRIISDLIRTEVNILDDFIVIDYRIEGKELYYTIEKKKTPETDLIMKAVRKIKKDKNLLLEKIKR